MNLYCLGCGVVADFHGGLLAISCAGCEAYSPFLVDNNGMVIGFPSSFGIRQLGGPHIEYYLGYSDHESEAKTAMIRVMREKGLSSQAECSEARCQQQYERKRAEKGRRAALSEQTSYRVLATGARVRTVVVVGCGGTGGFVSEGLCRLLPPEYRLVLVDHDRVEENNLIRQSFYPQDLGRFKSQVLAERLCRLYGREIAYSLYPFRRSDGHYTPEHGMSLIIGCVDNSLARTEIARSIIGGSWWVDAGNGYHSGQVLLGNIATKGDAKSSFYGEQGVVTTLPLPSLQSPALLTLAEEPVRQLACAQAVETGDQSPVINQAMATLVLDMVQRLFRNTLTYMGAYLDLSVGTLQYDQIEPNRVARIMGVTRDFLMSKKPLPSLTPCANCGRYHA